MFGKSITLFKLFGFSVRIDLSWLVILGLVVWSLAGLWFPQQHPGLHWSVHLGMGLAAAFGLFASIVIHELCHSLIARRHGLPIKGITLFIFGGVAEMNDEPPSAKAEFRMAIAGPAASAVVAGVAFGAAQLGQQVGWPETVTGVLTWLAFINAALLAFNLIPGFPLDGGRVLRAVLWGRKGDLQSATATAARVGRAFGAVLFGLGIFSLLMNNLIGGLWWILIGLFIRHAASQGYQQVLIRQMLQGVPVRRFMTDRPVTVAPSVPLDAFVENYVYAHHHKLFPVVEDGRLVGVVTTRGLQQIPSGAWSNRTVADVAADCDEQNTIDADADAMKALQRMQQGRAGRLVVVEDGELAGVLALKDLLDFISLKFELEAGRSADAPPVAPLTPNRGKCG
ncbi:MAG: site-2 protease family protein [Phycisphaerae bacterium]|nr:site-2 protease family protein [Phycisphaerae bacterium]